VSDTIKEIVGEELNNFAQDLIPESPLFLEKTATKKTLLEDPNAPALLVYKAPETIWAESQTRGIDIPEENRNKILMIAALKTRDPLIYDAHAFKNIVLVFNDELPNTEIAEEALPEQMAWAIECLEALDPTKSYYFDYEPVYYTALVLHRDGYFLAPQGLEYAQMSLDKLNKNIEVKSELQAALKKPEKDMTDLVREQYIKMDRVKRYVEHKREESHKAESLLRETTHG
jgi:hypothetical protein